KQTAAPSEKETSPAMSQAAMSQSTMAMSFITSGASGGSEPRDDEHAPGYVKQSYLRRRYGTPLQMLTSPMLRLAVALVLLTAYANWWNINFGPNAIGAVNEVATTHQRDAVDIVKDKDVKAITQLVATEARKAESRPLEFS